MYSRRKAYDVGKQITLEGKDVEKKPKTKVEVYVKGVTVFSYVTEEEIQVAIKAVPPGASL